MTLEPKYTPVSGWVALTGMTRTGTYEELRRGNLRAIKQPGGRRTLIDVEHGLTYLRSQALVTLGAAKTVA